MKIVALALQSPWKRTSCWNSDKEATIIASRKIHISLFFPFDKCHFESSTSPYPDRILIRTITAHFSIDCINHTTFVGGSLSKFTSITVLNNNSNNFDLIFEFFCPFSRFGGFEEFKRHNLSPDGTLTSARKLLCGMGKFLFIFKFIELKLRKKLNLQTSDLRISYEIMKICS